MPLYGEWTIPLQDDTQLEWNQQLNVLSRVATWARSFSRARSFSSSFLASCPSPPCCQEPFCTAAIPHNCWGRCPVATSSSRCRTGRCPLAARGGRCGPRGSILGLWLCFFCCTKGIKPPARKRCFPILGKLAALPAGEHPHLLFLSKKPTRCIIFFQFGCSVSHIAPVTGRREAGKCRLLCSCQ